MKRKIITALTLTFAVATVFVSGPMIMITGATRNNGDDFDNSISANSAEVIAAEACQETFEINWSERVDEITAAILGANGGIVDVVTGDVIEIPSDVLRFIAGSNAILALHAREGLGFSIIGKDVDVTAETLKITVSSIGISEAAKQAVLSEAAAYCEFNLEEKDALPFRMNAHMIFGQQHAGKTVVLYSHDDSNGSWKAVGIFRANEHGQAVFELHQGGSYLAVVMDQDYTVKKGDTLTQIAGKYGTTVKALRAANPHIADADMIQPGEVIRLY